VKINNTGSGAGPKQSVPYPSCSTTYAIADLLAAADSGGH
jgi:hypothetical protein